MTAAYGGETLRALVREVLRELLPGGAAASGNGAPSPAMTAAAAVPPAQPGPALTVHESVAEMETVSLRTDQDLAAFVLRLLHLFENPKHRDDLRAGRLRFRLAARAVDGTAGAAGSAQPVRRIGEGAVTEAAVREAAGAGARLVLGRRAVLTPLARDRARACGVQIDKERE